MDFDYGALGQKRQELIDQILQQAELYIQHNVQECRSLRNIGNRWLFRCGMQQGIALGVDYFLNEYSQLKTAGPLPQTLFAFKAKVVETCQLWPHKAIENWDLSELIDRVDIEREDVINGLQHGLCAVGHNLPRLVKRLQTKRAPRRGPSMRVQAKI